MNIVAPINTSGISGLTFVDETPALEAITQTACAAAVFQRSLPKALGAWLDNLEADQLPRGRVILPPSDVPSVVQHLFDASDLPDGPERDWLNNDISQLAETFATLMSADFIRLRLDVITTNACRKFHIDAIRARLICTYRGTGTQFGNAPVGGEPDHVLTVGTGAVSVLRGTLWPATPGIDLKHRSPPIEGTGETRLVLVLDPVTDPDEVG